MVDDFLRLCPNVISINFGEKSWGEIPPSEEQFKKTTAWVWTSKFGSRIQKLQRCTTTLAVRPSLPPVSLVGLLREFFLLFPGFGFINGDFWETVGGTLESFKCVGCLDRASMHMEKIELHCRKMREIAIAIHHNEGNDALCRLLASYGKQLEWAYLKNMNESQYNVLKVACPNARFYAYITGYGYHLLASTLNVLGPQLSELFLGPEHQHDFAVSRNHDYSNWTRAWNKAIKLRELRIYIYHIPGRLYHFLLYLNIISRSCTFLW